MEYGTEEPIAGAEVKMVNREAGLDTVAITTTNSNGNFSYSHKGPISFGLCSYVFKEQYYTNLGTEGPGTDKFCHRWGELNTPIIAVKPYAWLKLRLINTSGATELHINRLVGSKSGVTIYNSLDTTVVRQVWGNYIVSIPIFIDSSIATRRDTVMSVGHDTVYYEIEY